ncbi:cell division protein SepF [Aceticella autotrophica]|uniref:Cell division protein SepF n=1 Tax=Aceticella autotrophica TaxID=2755338 RepID=A0A975AXG3_9THEO|nr:cell division protein SepF [Aceticella autotrophica]QSZ28198.1 cell division protein SepF [Aceticella autotrophica]
MSGNVINKLLSFFGMEEPEEIDETERVIPFNKKTKIVNIHTQPQVKVLIAKPEEFQQAQNICLELKNKKPVIIDVQSMDKNDAQRLIDFISGAIFALNGEIKKISNFIFLVVPDNFDISGDIQEQVNSIYNLSK